MRCVVAAGWAVDDEAAQWFATTFYENSAGRIEFHRCGRGRRAKARERGGNTWAAYQCYGDPDWTYRRGTGDAQRPIAVPVSQELAGIASIPALVVALDTLAGEERIPASGFLRSRPRVSVTLKIRFRASGELAARWPKRSGKHGQKPRRFDQAIDVVRARCEPPLTERRPSAAMEQLANLRIRRASTLVGSRDRP